MAKILVNEIAKVYNSWERFYEIDKEDVIISKVGY